MAEQKVSNDPMLQTEEEINRLKSGKGLDEEKHLDFGDDDIVTVRNILEIPFRFKFKGGLYEVGAGDATEMPGFMAWHYLKKFADYYYRQIEKTPEKARARHYKRNDPIFKRLIVSETKVPEPVNADNRGKVIKLEPTAKLDKEIKEDADFAEGDQVLPERKVKPEKDISDAEFDRGMTDQDKKIEEKHGLREPEAESTSVDPEAFPDANTDTETEAEGGEDGAETTDDK